MSCRYKSFFICKGNILASPDSLPSRTDSDHSHNSRNQNICFRHTCKLQKPIHSSYNLYIHILKAYSQILRRIFIPYRNQSWMKLSGLFFQHFYISPGADSQHFNITISSYHIQCLGADRSCRAQNCNFLHVNILSNVIGDKERFPSDSFRFIQIKFPEPALPENK